MSYSYETAKTVLSEGEKDRILAIYLSTDEPNVCQEIVSSRDRLLSAADFILQVDWEKATQAFGAASVESMKVSTRNLLKKIEKAGGKVGVTASSTTVDKSAPSTPKTPKTPKGKVGRPRKRKAETPGSDEDDEAPKSLRKKAAKNAAGENDDEDEEKAAPKTPKKARSSPGKSTKKTPLKQKADEDEEMAENINVASEGEPDSKKVKEEQDDEEAEA